MNTIVKENQITFKDLEKKIYKYVCELGQELTKTLLEQYDGTLSKERDKKEYRNKGGRNTTIKTIYGEVSYTRNVYESKTEEGKKTYIYLLDQALSMDKIGFISTNLAEKIAEIVTDAPYRVSAKMISETCGQSISHGGAWNVIQQIGMRIEQEEKQMVYEMNQDIAKGIDEIPVLFEEMDGVWLKMQGKNHKKVKSQELKVAVIYEGWEKDGKKNSRLNHKKVIAGMEQSNDFHEKREAQIHRNYKADEIKQRILNGDGGSWIKDPYDSEAIFQLDSFHIYQGIRRKISNKEVEKIIKELLDSQRIDDMLEFIKIYATSVESNDIKDKTSQKALELYQYLNNNKERLIPYNKRGIEIPKAPDHLVYKGMGVQENQNCTIVTMRMKHRRMRWSQAGAHYLAKVLYTKENKELTKTIERFTDSIYFAVKLEETLQILSAAKSPRKDGKGNSYIDIMNHHMPIRDAIQTASIKALRKAFS